MQKHRERSVFPVGTSNKEPSCQRRRHKRRRFDSWVGKIPQRRKQQLTPVFLPGESHGCRSLVGYSPRGRKESDTTEQLHFQHFPLGLTGFYLPVQGTLKSLIQHHSSKESILRCLALFIVQLSHLCLTTRKTIALTRRTFVGRLMSLLFNMLSSLVITFLSFNFMAAITICSDFGA